MGRDLLRRPVGRDHAADEEHGPLAQRLDPDMLWLVTSNAVVPS